MSRVLRVLAVILAASLGGAPAAFAGGSTAALQAGFEAASQRAALAESAVQELQDRIVALEESLRAQGADRASGLASLQEVSSTLADLRGQLEVLQFEVKTLRADLDQYTLDQERRTIHAESRLANLERTLGVAPPPPPSLDGAPAIAGDATGSAEAPADLPTLAPGDVDGRIALAETRMKNGQQAAARAILEQAVNAAPDHARLPEVRYRLAETWFNEGKWREAARAFQVVTDNHAKSAWAPWAMLRIGECFDGMGRKDAAATFYDGVLRSYPNSDAAKEARRLRTP